VRGKKMGDTCGWTGKILRVDLSSGKSGTLLTRDLAERFIGGRGFVSKIYWDEVSTKPMPCILTAHLYS
jgi:aldehyde:ferredoxin oxidoreductase